MSGPGRRFDPSELLGGTGPEPTSAELADALAAARVLEAHASGDRVEPGSGFEDGVMAAIATEPAPRLVVRATSAGRGGRAAAFLATVRDAWVIATSGGRPLAVRAQALGFVLVVVMTAGSLTGAAAVGVGSLLAPRPSPGPSLPVPAVSPSPISTPPAPSSSPSPPVDAIPSPSPSSVPADTFSPTPTTRATQDTRTPEATDMPGPSETVKPDETHMPGETMQPTETPDSSETPEASDDHGRGGGGSSGPG